MKNTMPLYLALLGVLSAVSASATTIMNENFDYANSTEMIAAGWSNGPTGFTSLDSGTNKTARFGASGAGNGTTSYYDFTAATGMTLTQDFTLTVNSYVSTYGNRLHVLMVSAPDVNNVITGYGFYWDTATSTSWGGKGYVQITKVSYDLDTTTMSGLTAGSSSGLPASVTSNVVAAPAGTTPTSSTVFSPFVLSWDSVTHSISLSVNGLQRLSVNDSSYSSFSRIYVAGAYNSSYFDSISLTTTATSIPEPSSFAAMAGGLGLMAVVAVRRKRPASLTT